MATVQYLKCYKPDKSYKLFFNSLFFITGKTVWRFLKFYSFKSLLLFCFFLEFEGPLPDILQEVHVPIVSDAACNENYQGGIDPDTNICAGVPEGGRDTCQGG